MPSFDKQAYRRAKYLERKLAGLCVRCGGPCATAFVQCPKCRDYYKDDYETNKRLGLCGRCGGDLDDPRRVNCEQCRKYHTRKAHERQRRFVREGRCRYCGREPRPGMTTCERCGKRQRKSSLRAKHRNKECQSDA